jgi:hypothetical protein
MLFHDQPISSQADDVLNRHHFVLQLAEAIFSWSLDEPLVIGIYAGWGDGKTSFLNLLIEQLQTRVSTLLFDPWYFNSQEEVIRIFFQNVFGVVSRQLPWVSAIKLRRKARQFAGKLTSLPISIGYGGASFKLSDLKPQAPGVNILKRELEDILRSRSYDKRKKIVILIDNLDRLPPNEIMLMLKLIRLCSDFKDFIYVIAFDDKYVIDAIDEFMHTSEHSVGGAEYLRKIIQTDLHLPTIELSYIDDFINRAFAKLQEIHSFEWSQDFRERFPDFYRTQLRGKVIKNLRDAKKLANSAAFTLPLIIGELNHADWLVTEALRVFAPSAYELVRSNIDALCPDYSSLGFQWASFEKSRWNQKYQSIQDAINRIDTDFALAALEFLFPVFASWKVDSSKPSITDSYALGDYSRQQRIASPDYKHAYFQFGPEPTRLPDRRVGDFIQVLNTTESEKRVGLITARLNEVKEEGYLKDLLDKLVLRVGLIEADAQIALVQSLAHQSRIFSKRESILMDSEEARAQALIFSIASDNEGSGGSQEILEKAIEWAAEDSFAIDIVLFATPSRNRILRDFEAIDYDRLKDGLRVRLRERLSGSDVNIFETEPTGYGYILYQWAGPLLEDRDAVVDYLDKLFPSCPQCIGKFLVSFVSSHPLANDDTQWIFDKQRLQEAFDPSWIRSNIDSIEGNLYTSDKEQWALDRFSEIFKNDDMGQHR